MLVEASEEARLWLAMLREVVVDLRRVMIGMLESWMGLNTQFCLSGGRGVQRATRERGKRASERAILRDTGDRLVVPEGL